MNVKKFMKRMTGVILSLTMIMGSFSVQAADSSVNTTDTAVLSEQEAENPAESGQEILIESVSPFSTRESQYSDVLRHCQTIA